MGEKGNKQESTMKKIVLYGHAGSGNHGCEALVRTTYDIFRKAGYEKDLTVSTLDETRDRKYGVPAEKLIQNSFSYQVSLLYRVMCKIHPNFLGIQNRKARRDYRPFFDYVRNNREDTLYVSIGGDNYCTRRPTWLYETNHVVDHSGYPRILWGCSVEPATISNQMVQDLNGYQVLVTRESITYQALKEKCSTKVVLYSDPAFVLPVEEMTLPEGFEEGNTIGINISPVIVRSETVSGMTMRNYKALIQHILDTTSMKIALIPHVTIPEDNDLEVLRQLYEAFASTGRVVMVGDASCTQLKYAISRCRLFIGARTHSTIAAYSTCVPTVVVGYSVKAKGIAKDLFGTYENYVKPVQSLQTEEELIAAYDWLVEHEEEIRKTLTDIMPAYIEKAWQAGEVIQPYLQ
jgi:polysaccharide pyruvyl transferase WcaK-like protein